LQQQGVVRVKPRRLIPLAILVIVAVLVVTHLAQIQSAIGAISQNVRVNGLGAPPSLPFGQNGGNTAVPTAIVAQPPPASVIQDYTNRVIARTNQYRVQNGCPALTENPILMGTAQAHSEDMAIHDFVGHQSSDGTPPWQRIQDAGFRFAIVAENVAWGQPTPEDAVDAWFNETPPNDLHRQNILNCKLRDIGVGYYYLKNDPGTIQAHYYWTEDFGTPAS
jgi:uncharacterized protein YkwD